MRYTFDTSAFLPIRGRHASAYQHQWERYTLSMTPAQHARVMGRRDRLAEEASSSGRWGRYRAYDRAIVRRYAV